MQHQESWHDPAYQAKLARHIGEQLNIEHFELGAEEIAFFETLCRRFPSGQFWAVTREEGMFLYLIAAALKPSSMIEIGTCGGISTAYLLGGAQKNYRDQHRDDVLLHTFDFSDVCLPMPEHALGFAIQTMAPEMQHAARIYPKKASMDVPDVYPANTCPLVFIDGMHDHPWPLFDFLHVLPCLTTGAWVILHDINLPKALYQETPSNPPSSHGAQWFYRQWRWKKFSIGGAQDNIGVVQLPTNRSDLLPFIATMFKLPHEAHASQESFVRICSDFLVPLVPQ